MILEDGGREIRLSTHVSQHVVLSMRELTEDAIDALVNVELCLVIDVIGVDKLVVLESVRMDGQLEVMHLLDEWRVAVVYLARVPIELLVGQRIIVHDVCGSWADAMGNGTDLVEVVRLGVAREHNKGQV